MLPGNILDSSCPYTAFGTWKFQGHNTAKYRGFLFSSKVRIVELPILTIDITDGWHPILTLLEKIISIYLTIKVRLGKWSPPDH